MVELIAKLLTPTMPNYLVCVCYKNNQQRTVVRRCIFFTEIS